MSSASLPRHVAVIMDGNGRWAQNQGLPRHHGHRKASTAVREVVRACRQLGIPYLTLYAFSVANWARPRVEVTALMRLLVRFALREVEDLRDKKIAVHVIGHPEDLPELSRRALTKLVDQTRDDAQMHLTLALSYGGRNDITRAARMAASLVAEGKMRPDEVTEPWIRKHLSTGDLPDTDLVIRTGGEQRLSDFLPFESAYAEFWFTPVLWPDFRQDHLHEAVQWYQSRERRFGKTGQQVKAGT